LAKYLAVRSEGGQDCREAQDKAQASGVINPAGLNSGNPVGSIRPHSGSFVAMDLDKMDTSDSRSDVKPEPDNWMGGVLM